MRAIVSLQHLAAEKIVVGSAKIPMPNSVIMLIKG
jgi:hypothetical protein